jgi:hypothetical protein
MSVPVLTARCTPYLDIESKLFFKGIISATSVNKEYNLTGMN